MSSTGIEPKPIKTGAIVNIPTNKADEQNLFQRLHKHF